MLRQAESLQAASFELGSAEIMWGDFTSVVIDFIVIALVVYYIVKGLGLDKADKAKPK